MGLIFVVVACSGAPATTQGESATTTGEATSSSTTTASTDGMSSTSASGSTTTTTTGASTSEPSTTTPGCTFLDCIQDVGEDVDCDPFLQDCPEGEKCNAWANDGGGAWNANKCVPVDPDPDAVGEPCTVVGSAVSGLDSCEEGAMCWYVDPETNTGHCVAVCDGDPEQCSEEPESCCSEGSTCTIYGGGNLVLCLQRCDPLLQECAPMGLACYPVGSSFQCARDSSGDLGQPGDPCEFINTCDPGTYCGNPAAYPGCELLASGCCTPFCDLNASDCVMGTECQPWYDPMDTPPGYEGLGACVIP